MSRPIPWLTLGVFAVTALVTALQFIVPGLVEVLRRDPRMLSEFQVWRFVTAWLVHPDGVLQIFLNLWLLLFAGTLAEWFFPRFVWGLAYVVAGLAGEIAGLFWQPVGGGCSVAVLGLVGLLLVRMTAWQGQGALQRYLVPTLGFMAAFWLTMASNIHGPALMAGIAVGLVIVRPNWF